MSVAFSLFLLCNLLSLKWSNLPTNLHIHTQIKPWMCDYFSLLELVWNRWLGLSTLALEFNSPLRIPPLCLYALFTFCVILINALWSLQHSDICRFYPGLKLNLIFRLYCATKEISRLTMIWFDLDISVAHLTIW